MTNITGLTYEFNEYSKMVIRDVNNYSAKYAIDGKIKHKGAFEIDKDLHKDPSMRIVSIALEKYFFFGIPIRETITKHTNIYDFAMRLKVDSRFEAQLHYLKPTNEYSNLNNDEKLAFIIKEGWQDYYGSWIQKSWITDRLPYDRMTTSLEGAFSISSAKYTVYDKDFTKLSKTTRYYVSNHGGALYKRSNDGSGKMTGVSVGSVVTVFNKYIEKSMPEYDINYDFYVKECNKLLNQIEDKQLSLF